MYICSQKGAEKYLDSSLYVYTLSPYMN